MPRTRHGSLFRVHDVRGPIVAYATDFQSSETKNVLMLRNVAILYGNSTESASI